ncbi:MAG: PH domain-containing protein [Nakamurella sp.]
MSEAPTAQAPVRQFGSGIVIADTRLHPIYLVIETAKTLRSAIPFLLVTILGGAPSWVNVVLFVLIMLIAIAQWYVKKYSVISGVLRLRSGLINRSVRVVPITRITALAAARSLTQRLIGVWSLKVQSPGDRNGSAVVLNCLSGRRLDELRTALESGHETQHRPGEREAKGSSTIQRYLAWRRTGTDVTAPEVISVLTTTEMLIAAVTNNSIPLIFAGALVVWFRFTEYIPPKATDFMQQTIEPRGVIAVLIALVVVAIVGGVTLGALRLNQFTLIRDGDVLRNTRGLLGKQEATIPINRIQAIRVVEGFWRTLLGYCSLQVEVAGVGRVNTSRRMLFPLIRTDRARALIDRALPELAWPSEPLHPIPQRIHRRYLTLPLEYGAGFTLLLIFLPGWWAWLAVLPIPAAIALGVARAREGGWFVNDRTVILRWRRGLSRQTVVAHLGGPQKTAWNSSPFKAQAHVAGFEMHFSSGREAKIRYMGDTDALMLLHAVGRRRPEVERAFGLATAAD